MLVRAFLARPLTACILVLMYALAPAAHLLLDHAPSSGTTCCPSSTVCHDQPDPTPGPEDDGTHNEHDCAVCAILGFKYLTIQSHLARALTICADAPLAYVEEFSGLAAPRSTPIRGPPILRVM
jgi:hypothetical protein